MEKKDRTHRVTFEVPEEKHKQLKVLAATHGYKMRELIDLGIDYIIKKFEQKQGENK